MTGKIYIGNQTAFSASSTMEPLEFAVEQGFGAFEWFADKKTGDDAAPAGWDEADMDEDKRHAIRKIGESHDILYTVHAPWQANPLQPDGEELLKSSVDFARDIGANLVNLHLYLDQGAQAYVDALAPVITYSARSGVRISIENTPLTGPADFNATFKCLQSLGTNTRHVGMCLDIGHANLFAGTRNDYIRYLDELAPEVPIIHLHLHENWGDGDSHLTLFTGPARDNEAGVRTFVERLHKRRYSGAIILEQWPQPPQLLVAAEQRLHALFQSVKRERHRRRHKSAEGASPPEEPEPHPLAPPLVDLPSPEEEFCAGIAAAHARYPSWRQRLSWIREVVSAPGFTAGPEQLASLAIYLRFMGTGVVKCEEDGRHFRPHHHASAALAIEDTLAAVTAPLDRWILRKIHPWLPSYSKEFQRSEPLTRIRDIAHRNDIPKALKQEIKHRLQNKLHRCAGPEDLKTSREILELIRAPGVDYSPEFVEQFRIFNQELSEFFNAGTLDQRLEGLLPSLPAEDAARTRRFLLLKANRGRPDADLLELLAQLTALRECLSQRIPEAEGEQSQRLCLADIGLEDYAFALLSEAANRFHSRGWNSLLAVLAIAVTNVRLSDVEAPECAAVMSELQAWTPMFDPTQRFHLLRLKATLERARRIADSYSDRVLALFPPRVTALGQTLGIAEHTIKLFCEGDIRGNVIFQLAKLVEIAQRDIDTSLNLSPWATLVPGEASGRLLRCATLEKLSLRDRPVIVLLDKAGGDEEIPDNVRGILLCHPIPHLSHMGVRARQAGVPFATCEHRQSLMALESHLHNRVSLRITADDVVIGPAAPPTGPRAPVRRKEKRLVPAVELCQGSHTVPLKEATSASCGAKAAAAAKLLTLAKKSAGLFCAPQGLVLPFGAMQHSLGQQPVNNKEYLACRACLHQADPEALDGALKRLRDILLGLPITSEVSEEIRLFFGASARLAVRSSANGEDLENLASAGLYNSRIGVSAADSGDAVRQVWASLWTPRAVMSRTQYGIPHADIHMAVLIQEMVAPELSFIMHTADPLTGDRGQAWVELAPGLGETLASASQPGTPYRMWCNRNTGEAALNTCASFSLALRPAPRKGLKQELIDYSTVPLSADPSAAAMLGERLAEIAEFLETQLEAPQDVEGIITAEDIHIVQTRPQQGYNPG